MELFSLLGEFLKLFGSVAPEAAAQAVVVLVSVFMLRLVKVLPNGKWARAANIVFTVILSGVVPTEETAALYALTAALAGGLWELCVWLAALIKAQIKK